ncbi:MAG: AsmA family protein [Bacteroidetes bacterium]|nr:MAG: AsmA family protein [Bacteroidota bacterium]
MKALKKILKWIVLVFIGIILFIVAAPFIFKGKIIVFVKEEVNKTLNAKVDFGDFDLTLLSSFPNFSLSIDKVSVANVGDFTGDTLFSVKNLSATVDLMSVIKGDQYKIRSILLDSPRIMAEVLANGKANWDITKPDSTPAAAESGEAAKFKMSLKKLEIKNAHIVYDDALLGVYSLLDNFNYTMGGDFTQDNFEMTNDMSIDGLTVKYGGIAYMNKVKTVVKAAIGADMPNFKFTFKENEISLNEVSLGINGTFAMPGDDMDMDMQFKANQTEFKNILSLVPAVYTKDFASVKTAGKFSLDAFVKGAYASASAPSPSERVGGEVKGKMPAFGANLKVDDAMFQYPSLPKAVNDIAIDVSVKNADGDPDHTITDIKKFHMEMAGNPIDISAHIETPVSDPTIGAEIMGRLNLASVKDIVPMEGSDLNGNITADVKMKGRMSSIEKEKYDEFDMDGTIIVMGMNYKSPDLPQGMTIKSMTMNFSPQYVEMKGFDSKIGKSDIQANGMIENILQYVFKDSLLQGTFSMKSSVMDLNEFMSEEEETATAAADTAPLSIIEVPKNIDFILNASISKLLYDDIEIKDMAGSIIIRGSKVMMNKLKMSAMGGTMLMSGTYSTVNPKVPSVDFDMNISDFDIPMTFKYFNTVQKLAPVGKYATGKFSTQLKYVSNLDAAMMPDMKTMNGDGKLQTKSVVIAGFEPLNKLADALGGMDKFKKTEFSDLDLTYHIKDGKISTDEFPFKSGSILGNIAGSTALDQTIDYTMKMEIPTADMPAGAKAFVTKQLSAVNKLGTNLKLPEKVKIDALFGGTVMKPTVKANMKDMAGSMKEAVKEQVKEVVKEKINEVKEDVSKKIEAQKQKILSDAKVQADKIRSESKNLAAEAKKAGYAQADNIEKEAKNPIAKLAAKKAAEKMRKETDEKAKNIESEGNQKADGMMKTAQEQADKIK